jgi:hypothetical protein
MRTRVAVFIAVSLLIPGSAMVARAGAAPSPLLTCSTISGNLSLNPPLPPVGDTTKVTTTVTDTGALTGCSGGGVTGGNWTGTGTFTGSCLGLAFHQAITRALTITWSNNQTSTATATARLFGSPTANPLQFSQVATITGGLFAGGTSTVTLDVSSPGGNTCQSTEVSEIDFQNADTFVIAPGTATCKGGTSTATISPAWPPATSKTTVHDTITATGTLTGCSGGGVTSGTFRYVGVKSKTGDNCKTNATYSTNAVTSGTLTITWDTKATTTASLALHKVKGKPKSDTVTGTVSNGVFSGSSVASTFGYTFPVKTECVSAPAGKVNIKVGPTTFK